MRQTQRERDLHALRSLVQQLDTGPGGVVIITGPPGAGTTHLIREALAQAPGRIAVLQLTRPGQVAVTLPDSQPVTVAPGLADRVRQQAARAPVVLLVDDAPGLDDAAWDELTAAVASSAELPLLVLVAGADPDLRQSPAWRALNRSRGPITLSRIELGPLTDREIRRLLRALGLGTEAQLAAAARIAAGNPRTAVELCGPGRGPRELLTERIWAVDAGEVLAVLALVERPVSSAFLSGATGLDPCRLATSLANAREAGLVRSDERTGRHQLTFTVLADTIAAQLTPERTRELHLAVVAALDRTADRTAGSPSESARHLVASGLGGARTAQACLEAGLWEEARGGYVDAEELATYGLDVDGADSPVRAQLQRLLGRCHGRAGRLDAARDAFERVIELARAELTPVDVAECVDDLARTDLTLTAPNPSRAALLEEALAGAGDRPELRARLLAALSATTYYTNLTRSRLLAAQALALAAPSSDDATRAVVHDVFAIGAVASREHRAVEALGRRWSSLGPRHPPGPLPVELGPALIRGDRPAVEYALARQARSGVRLQSERERGLLDAATLSRAVTDGDQAEIARLAPGLRRHACPDVTALSVVTELIWSLHTGAPLAPTALEVSTLLTLPMARLFLGATAVISIYHGDTGARAALPGLLQDRATVPGERLDAAYDAGVAVLALLGGLAEDAELSREAVARLELMPEGFVTLGMVVTVGPVGWFSAWAHAGAGDAGPALEANARALRACEAFGAGPWTVQCLLQGASLRRGSDPALGAALARAAAERADALGLEALAARARRLAELEPSPAGSRRHRQILQLAAQGLTNDEIARRLFLSVSTVERHFTHIYRALAVRNRAEAVAAIAAGDAGVWARLDEQGRTDG